MSFQKLKPLKDKKGQGLIEYLIIVALVAVAAIGIMQTLQTTVNKQFTNVTNAISGQNMKSQKIDINKVRSADHKKRGLGDFMNRANQKK